MAPNHGKAAAGWCKGARDQLRELAVANDEHAIVRADRDLLLDLERGRGRLREHGHLRRQRVGDNVEIFRWKRQVFGERSVASCDPENSATFAMGGASVAARFAFMAYRVDLADHAVTNELLRPFFDHADELVSRDAGERVVAMGQLDVGVADAGKKDPHERFAAGYFRSRHVVAEVQLPVFEPESSHWWPIVGGCYAKMRSAEMTPSKFEQLLVQTQLVSPALLAIAQRDAKMRGTRLGPALIDLGLVDEARFAEWVAALTGTSVLQTVPEADVQRLHQRMPRSIAREFEVVPVSIEGDVLSVAMLNPLDSACLDVLRTATGLKIRPLAALHSELMQLVTAYYPEDAVDPTILPGNATISTAEGDIGDESPGSQTLAHAGAKDAPAPASQLDRVEEQLGGLVRAMDILQQRVDAMERALERVLPR